MTLTPADQTFLAQAYGWNVVEVGTLHQGENTTHVVTTRQGKYALRHYRRGRYTPAEVNAELEWLAALAGTVPVVPALLTRDGARSVFRKQGGLTDSYAAFPFVVGSEPDPPTLAEFERLGRLLRQLHDAAAHILSTRPKTWVGYERPAYNLSMIDRSLESFLQTSLLDTTAKQRCKALAQQLQKLYAVCTPAPSFVHADLHFGNVLLEGNRWTLLDFDECGFGFSAFDLGTVRFHTLARGLEGWSAFLEGYGDPLPSATEIRLGTAMRTLYTAGKLPLRLDIPEVRDNAAGLIQNYLLLAERELTGAAQLSGPRQRRATLR